MQEIESSGVLISVDEKNIVHASINELGKTTGGKKGDQTGKEICVRSYYTYRGGWDYQLRYEKPKKEEKEITNGNQKIKSSPRAFARRLGANQRYRLARYSKHSSRIS